LLSNGQNRKSKSIHPETGSIQLELDDDIHRHGDQALAHNKNLGLDAIIFGYRPKSIV